MTKEQKKFILEKLIPFILRENGRGFAMDSWRCEELSGEVEFDDVIRAAPSCGTVACIGGSIELLKRLFFSRESTMETVGRTVGRCIGLTEEQADVLFYGWCDTDWHKPWPAAYRLRYQRAKTALGKARVAVALLKRVVATNGKVLD